MQQSITYAYYFKGHKPKIQKEHLALRHILKMIHLGPNKVISSRTVIELYFASADTQKQQCGYWKLFNLEELRKGIVKLPQP